MLRAVDYVPTTGSVIFAGARTKQYSLTRRAATGQEMSVPRTCVAFPDMHQATMASYKVGFSAPPDRCRKIPISSDLSFGLRALRLKSPHTEHWELTTGQATTLVKTTDETEIVELEVCFGFSQQDAVTTNFKRLDGSLLSLLLRQCCD